MSVVFMDFADSMIQTELIRKDPHLSKKLFATTTSIVSLVTGAVQNPLEDNLPSERVCCRHHFVYSGKQHLITVWGPRGFKSI
jgi:hypothetical protein